MADVRAMVVFQGGSNLPEDRFINTWHFSNLSSYSTHYPQVQEALADFYNEVPSVGFLAVGKYLSPYVKRPYEIKCYDLDDPEPRVPVEIAGTLPSVSVASGLPEEVAVCFSFHGDPPITPRKRGRIYLGPLCTDGYDDGDTTTPARPKVGLQQSLMHAGVNLLAADVGWSVRSVAGGGTMTPVTGGFIDNACDTQRRRGPAPSSRYVFPIV